MFIPLGPRQSDHSNLAVLSVYSFLASQTQDLVLLIVRATEGDFNAGIYPDLISILGGKSKVAIRPR